MMKSQQHDSTSQQLIDELVNKRHLSIKLIAQKCQLSEATLYLILKGSHDSLRPQSFSKLLRFYSAITIAS